MIIADDNIIDEIAIEQAMSGRRVRLTGTERAEAIRRLTARGFSAAQIGDRIGISGRQVVRYRRRLTELVVAA